MKKQFLFIFFATLTCMSFAQSINIAYTNGMYSSNPTVSFTVSWTGSSRGDKGGGKIYHSKVWILVDYKKTDGTWERATIATLNGASQGSLSFDGSNRRGFWLDGGSGNVESKVTVTLSDVPEKFNWCAFVSDRPPVAHIMNSDVHFSGTEPFVVMYEDASTATFINKTGNTITKKIVSLTDKTDCPSTDIQVAPPNPVIPCSGSTYFNFGTVSFTAGTEITISSGTVTQIWSRPVTATGCQKATYNGGSDPNFNVDCRTNPIYAGHLFSWCAVNNYQTTLCPSPWRVPSKNDFINLDKALGGNGVNRTNNYSMLYNYIVSWGGQYAGYCEWNGTYDSQEYGDYWGAGESSQTLGIGLGYSYVGYSSFPQYTSSKYYGFTLRCVR